MYSRLDSIQHVDQFFWGTILRNKLLERRRIDKDCDIDLAGGWNFDSLKPNEAVSRSFGPHRVLETRLYITARSLIFIGINL